MIWGELAALATAVCWSFTAIFFSYSGRRVGSDVVNRSRLLFALLLLLIATVGGAAEVVAVTAISSSSPAPPGPTRPASRDTRPRSASRGT